MHDNLNANGDGEIGRDRARKAPETTPMADREVPIGQRAFPSVMHAWLDGDMPEAAVRREHAKDVDMWKQITAEASARRHLRTPSHVEAQIMAALPQSTPQLVSPWYRREFVIAPTKAAFVAAGIALAAALLTAVLLRAF